jgi:hypothetical protein
VLKFDRVVLKKELNNNLKKVGEVFEIASVTEDSFILRDAKNKVAVGVISFKDFDKHFVKEKDFSGWTNWETFVGFDGQTDVCYRVNRTSRRKRVQVKFLTDNVRAEACCHMEDDFNLFFGIQLAYMRCLNKALEKKRENYIFKINECEEALREINFEIIDNDKTVEKMIDSLGD